MFTLIPEGIRNRRIGIIYCSLTHEYILLPLNNIIYTIYFHYIVCLHCFKVIVAFLYSLSIYPIIETKSLLYLHV